MTYEQATQFAQSWGLVLLAALFAAVVIYALWPNNRAEFERAARAPLTDGDEDGRTT